MSIPAYLPLDNCPTCYPLVILPCLETFELPFVFDVTGDITLKVLNAVGNDQQVTLTPAGGLVTLDFSAFDAGWCSTAQTWLVQPFNNDGDPIYFTMNDNIYPCAWITFGTPPTQNLCDSVWNNIVTENGDYLTV